MTNLTTMFAAISAAHVIMALVLLPISILIGFLPSILARQKEHFVAILLINIFLGWTVIGWIAALIWALTDAPKSSSNNPLEPERSSINNKNTTISEELDKLKLMRDSGMLSEDEFTKAKNKIIS
jgi:hypothetical protein